MGTIKRNNVCVTRGRRRSHEERDRALFKLMISKNFPTWGEIWTSKFKPLMGHSKVSIQNDHLQETYNKTVCNQRQVKNFKSNKRKNFS